MGSAVVSEPQLLRAQVSSSADQGGVMSDPKDPSHHPSLFLRCALGQEATKQWSHTEQVSKLGKRLLYNTMTKSVLMIWRWDLKWSIPKMKSQFSTEINGPYQYSRHGNAKFLCVCIWWGELRIELRGMYNHWTITLSTFWVRVSLSWLGPHKLLRLTLNLQSACFSL